MGKINFNVLQSPPEMIAINFIYKINILVTKGIQSKVKAQVVTKW